MVGFPIQKLHSTAAEKGRAIGPDPGDTAWASALHGRWRAWARGPVGLARDKYM